MTVSYTREVATAKLVTFGRLLFRWKASAYKLIWKANLFGSLHQRRVDLPAGFELRTKGAFRSVGEVLPKKCANHSVDVRHGLLRQSDHKSMVVDISIDMLPGPSLFLRRHVHHVPGIAHDSMPPRDRSIPKFGSTVGAARRLSMSVKRRFQTLDKVVADGFMTAEERMIYDNVKGENQLEKHHKYWLAIHWACDVLCQCYDKKAVRDPTSFKQAFQEIMTFRDKLGSLLAYDWVSIPLSYTQVVTMVVYAYFITSLISSQYLELRPFEACSKNSSKELSENSIGNSTEALLDRREEYVDYAQRLIQMYRPIFPILEFLFYMGWLKVAESVMNPLGQDDDDFEMNYIINRNLAVSYAIVDSYRNMCPQVKNETRPSLPESKVKAKQHLGSATDYVPSINEDEVEEVSPKKLSDDGEKGEKGVVVAFMNLGKRRKKRRTYSILKPKSTSDSPELPKSYVQQEEKVAVGSLKSPVAKTSLNVSKKQL